MHAVVGFSGHHQNSEGLELVCVLRVDHGIDRRGSDFFSVMMVNLRSCLLDWSPLTRGADFKAEAMDNLSRLGLLSFIGIQFFNHAAIEGGGRPTLRIKL